MKLFFLMGGLILLVSGTMPLLLQREHPSGRRRRPPLMWVRAAVFAIGAILAILLGIGVIALPGAPGP